MTMTTYTAGYIFYSLILSERLLYGNLQTDFSSGCPILSLLSDMGQAIRLLQRNIRLTFRQAMACLNPSFLWESVPRIRCQFEIST